MRVHRKVWRYVPAGAHPLHVGYILRAGGRWNRQGVYGCIYTAFTQQGARAEYHKYIRRETPSRFNREPKELVSIQVFVDPVMDLTDKTISPISPQEPFLIEDTPADLESCRSLADAIRRMGYVGIIAPSAALLGEKNLIIYIDGLAGNIHLDEGGDRVPL